MPGLRISSRRSLAVRMAGCGPVDPGSGQAAQKSRRRPHLIVINPVDIARVKVFNSSHVFSRPQRPRCQATWGDLWLWLRWLAGVMHHATDHLPRSLVGEDTSVVELHHRLGWVSREWGGGGQIEVGEAAHNLEVVGCGEPPGPGSSASVGEEVHGEGGRMG